MTSMYETLQDLPLFKGASKEQISAFLEKTHISFHNYGDGETVISRTMEAENVMFIITGKVKISHFIGTVIPAQHHAAASPIVLSETCSTGVFLCGEYLYGMDSHYPVEAVSVGRSSILEFSKEQFMRLLERESIFRLNYINYLSYQSQRAFRALTQLSDASLDHRLALYIFSLTSSKALEIEIEYTPAKLGSIIGISEAHLDDALSRLQRKRLLRYTPASIYIPSRRNFLDYVMEKETTA